MHHVNHISQQILHNSYFIRRKLLWSSNSQIIQHEEEEESPTLKGKWQIWLKYVKSGWRLQQQTTAKALASRENWRGGENWGKARNLLFPRFFTSSIRWCWFLRYPSYFPKIYLISEGWYVEPFNVSPYSSSSNCASKVIATWQSMRPILIRNGIDFSSTIIYTVSPYICRYLQLSSLGFSVCKKKNYRCRFHQLIHETRCIYLFIYFYYLYFYFLFWERTQSWQGNRTDQLSKMIW